MDKIFISPLVDGDRSSVCDLLQDEQTMRFLGPRRPLTDEESDAWLLMSNKQKVGLPFALLKAMKLLVFAELHYLMAS
ncbi:hypothetical protein L4C54_01700 [Vibrio lamellibrachiae]|uniref:hypothetical protein n=1 Tax=Vibrio lamellibrachiae TaxID=2910253 RepID=UPI003D13FF08